MKKPKPNPSTSPYRKPRIDGGRAQRNPVLYDAHPYASMKRFAEVLHGGVLEPPCYGSVWPVVWGGGS